MSKKQPIKVTIQETRHKTQKWTVTIDMPGNNPLDELRERYARVFTAKRGALRKLNAKYYYVYAAGIWIWGVTSNRSMGVIPIEFIVVKLKNSGPKKKK